MSSVSTKTRKSRRKAASRVSDQSRVVLRQGRKAVGVLISIEELKYFESLEDQLDVKAAREALSDPRRIPYEEVRRKLGL